MPPLSPQSEAAHYAVMRLIQETPDISQRQLAQKLGISASSVNYCLKALVNKGWVKMQNFSKSRRKLSYAYLLTPQGLTEKAVLTQQFLSRKQAEYEALKAEIEQLQAEVHTTQTTTQPHTPAA
jgi:EPS-associated MarR family transcriptional regulator